MQWEAKHPRANMGALGFIPSFLSEADQRPAAEQLHEAYQGGWAPFKGFEMLPDGSISYPGDPALPVLFEVKLRDETIRVYPYAWVAVIQPDGSFEIARMD
jgi:hypothetical protein